MLLCRNPYMASGGNAYGCGQCMPCRINRRRMWTHRIMLECTQHSTNSFWTLTYSDDFVPKTEGGLPTLDTKELTDFMKRLRFDYQPSKLRYFNVGEYGDITQRPHYHLALFAFPPCDRGLTRHDRRGNCCRICDRVRDLWGKGHVYSGQLEDASAAYIAGYVTKKMTSKEDPRCQGRQPEFARMSLKPGIGAGFIPEVASALLSHNLDSTLSDVPTSLAHGRSAKPLGRYLTRELRKHIGRPPDAPLSTIQASQEKLRPLQEIARKTAPKGTYSETYKALILSVNEGRYIQLEAKANRSKKRGSL